MDFVRGYWLGNTIEHWLIACGVFLFYYGLFLGLRQFFLARLQRLKNQEQKKLGILQAILESTHGFFLAFQSAGFALDVLTVPPKAEHRFVTFQMFTIFLQLGFWGQASIRYFIRDYIEGNRQRDPGRATSVMALGFLLQIAMWAFVGLLALNNYGVNVSALIAGLGIGGIAIALAVQNVLSDLLSSLAIVMDKPFVLGDAISVGGEGGVVEHIGLKTTRLKSDTGEQLIFSNSELLKSRIRNFQRMSERQIVSRVGVHYGTSRELLEKIPEMFRVILQKIPGVRFERCHLVQLSDSSINFELSYTVLSPAYRDYLDAQEMIHLGILSEFRAHKISIPHPTRTIYMSQEAR